MSMALIPLGQALSKNLLLSPCPQSYYNARNLGRWTWLRKINRQGQATRGVWVDLVEYKRWCWNTGRQLGNEQAQRLDTLIAQLTVEAAQG